MASVNYQKIKTAGEAKAKIAHDEKEKRKELEHTNPNIDKSMTDNNLSYRRKTLADGSEVALSYKDICEEYDAVMAHLDAKKGANKRKDRVTCLSLEVPTPDGLPESEEEDYFRNLGKIFEEEFEECYLLDGFWHADEKHKYYDPEDKTYKESRNHATFRYIPIKDGKLNAKATLTRAKMKQVNQHIEEMCQARYGLNFNNGKGKRGKSVEQLKAETNLAEMIKTDIDLENKRNELQNLNYNHDILEQKYNTLEKNYDKLKNNNVKIKNENLKLKDENVKISRKLKTLKESYDEEKEKKNYMKALNLAVTQYNNSLKNDDNPALRYIKNTGQFDSFNESFKKQIKEENKKVIKVAKNYARYVDFNEKEKENDGLEL